MATHVDDLPDELLLRILVQLPTRDIIDVVPFVCLRWSQLSLDSHIWRNHNYSVNCYKDAVKFFTRKPALRSVTFYRQVDEAVLRILASHCPTITSLGLDEEQPLTLDTIRFVTHNCDQIRELCVPSEVLSCPDKAREVALMPRLETLKVKGREHLLLSELGAGCVRLRHLDLEKAKNFHLGDLGAPLLRRLQGLSICCDSVSPDIVHCAESLEKLTLKGSSISSRPDSAVVEDLLPLKALTYVKARNFFSCPQLVRALMQPLLRSLNLWGCSNLDDDLLLELCRRCPLLEDLDLSYCTLITARGLSSMGSLRRLRRLYLVWCVCLGSGAMTHLARCSGLQDLSMECVDMDRMEPGVSQLLELRNLRVLKFEASTAIDLIPWEMFPKAFPHLRTLHLGRWNIPDTSVPRSLKAEMSTVHVFYINLYSLGNLSSRLQTFLLRNST